MKKLNLENLKTLRGIYAEAIETGEVPNELKSGLCWAYNKLFRSEEMYDYFGNKGYRDTYRWVSPSCAYCASIEQALVPRLKWLDAKISEMEANK